MDPPCGIHHTVAVAVAAVVAASAAASAAAAAAERRDRCDCGRLNPCDHNLTQRPEDRGSRYSVGGTPSRAKASRRFRSAALASFASAEKVYSLSGSVTRM